MRRWMLLAGLAVAFPSLASKPKEDALTADEKAVTEYKLTAVTVDKLIAASVKAQAVLSRNREAAEKAGAYFEESRSLDENVRAMEKVPGLSAAIKSAGLSLREFVTATMSMMLAVANSQLHKTMPHSQIAAGLDPGNAKFVDAHPELVAKWTRAFPSDSDKDDDADGASK